MWSDTIKFIFSFNSVQIYNNHKINIIVSVMFVQKIFFIIKNLVMHLVI